MQALCDGGRMFSMLLLLIIIMLSCAAVLLGFFGGFMVSAGFSSAPLWLPFALVLGGLGFGTLACACFIKVYES